MKTARNAPCPCGSGKKYKHCCLKRDASRRERAVGAQNRGAASEVPIRQAAARAKAWEADILAFVVRFEDDPGARPGNLLVTAEGFVIFTEVLARPSAEVDDGAAALQRGIFEAATRVGCFPAAVEVRESEVAAALARRLRDGGSPIPVRAAPLPGVDRAMAAISQAMGGRAMPFTASRPQLWAGWGHPDDWIAEVFRASAAYYRARPWRHFDDSPQVVAAMPAGGLWYLSIMGSAGIEYGLACYSDPGDPDRMFDDQVGAPLGRVISLTFDSGGQLPRPMRKEIAAAGWQVASADAYPVLLAIGTPAGGLRSTDARDLVAVLAAVAAWAAAIDRDRAVLSGGPWRDPETGVELAAGD